MSFNPMFVRDDAGQMYLPIADATGVVYGEPLKVASNLVLPVAAATDAPALIGIAQEAKVANDGKTLLHVNLAGDNKVYEICVDSATWAMGDTFAWKSVSAGIHQFEKTGTNPCAVAVETVAVAATTAKVHFVRGVNSSDVNMTATTSLSTGDISATGTLDVAGATSLDDSLVVNDSGADKDTRIEGDTATELVHVDASADSFEVGTTVQGALMKIQPATTVFNENSADIDFRVESNGDANCLFVDGGADNVGIGTATPTSTAKLHVVGQALVSGVRLKATTTLTIATGAVTATQGYHAIDTESAASSDDLDTISGGVVGDILIIKAANGAHTVVVKNGTGNIVCPSDRSLDNANDLWMGIYDGTNWLELAFVSNGA
jgi:hypothetical protein